MIALHAMVEPPSSVVRVPEKATRRTAPPEDRSVQAPGHVPGHDPPMSVTRRVTGGSRPLRPFGRRRNVPSESNEADI